MLFPSLETVSNTHMLCGIVFDSGTCSEGGERIDIFKNSLKIVYCYETELPTWNAIQRQQGGQEPCYSHETRRQPGHKRLCTQWVWQWIPQRLLGNWASHSVLLCFMIKHLSNSHTHLLQCCKHSMLSTSEIVPPPTPPHTLARFLFDANFACPHWVWSLRHSQPNIHTEFENKPRTAHHIEYCVYIWVSAPEGLIKKKKRKKEKVQFLISISSNTYKSNWLLILLSLNTIDFYH